MSTNDWGTFYAVYEHTAYTEFPTGRYDIGIFEVKQYSFDNPKELYKEFTHWSKDSIDEIIFLDEKEAKAFIRTHLPRVRGKDHPVLFLNQLAEAILQ
jgi:hypothetical protein